MIRLPLNTTFPIHKHTHLKGSSQITQHIRKSKHNTSHFSVWTTGWGVRWGCALICFHLLLTISMSWHWHTQRNWLDCVARHAVSKSRTPWPACVPWFPLAVLLPTHTYTFAHTSQLLIVCPPVTQYSCYWNTSYCGTFLSCICWPPGDMVIKSCFS